jgi:hypothetical protein
MRLANHITLDSTHDKNPQYVKYWALDLCTHTNTLLRKGDSSLVYNGFRYGIVYKGNVKGNIRKKFKLHKPFLTKSSYYLYNRVGTVSNFGKYLEDYRTSKEVTRLRLGYTYINSLSTTHLLRKERSYTKLKYSRSPSYDIVSGGSAALLAGLLGFLISEKFGMELVDSGDFYYLFMYLVFLSLSVRPLLLVSNVRRSLFNLISIKRAVDFYITLFMLFINGGR